MFQSSLQEEEGGVVLSPKGQNPVPRYVRFNTDRPDTAITAEYVRSIHLTPRDKAIIRLIGEMGYLATSQVARLWFAHTTRPSQKAGDRLRRLWEQHVLDREVGSGLAAYGLPCQLVHMLGRAGRHLIGEHSQRAGRRRAFGLLTTHNVLVGEVAVGLMEALRTPQASAQLIVHGERYVSFNWDGRAVKLRPDALFVLKLGESELPFFVELDTGTESMDAFVTKQLSYNLYFRSNTWREHHRTFPGLLVVCAARGDTEAERQRTAQRRLDRIVRQIRDRRTENGVKWFFTTLSALGTLEWKALVGRNEMRTIRLPLSES